CDKRTINCSILCKLPGSIPENCALQDTCTISTSIVSSDSASCVFKNVTGQSNCVSGIVASNCNYISCSEDLNCGLNDCECSGEPYGTITCTYK
ncbi:9345_t:CDS:1, partial [Dentiscutata heterogama]